MRAVESAELDPTFPLEAIRSTLEAHPVRLAVLFGSHARGDSHARSDIDLAVEFEGIRPGQPAFNEAFFGLSADLSEVLETDDIDLVDVHSLSPPLARSVFDDGVILVGSERRAEQLRAELGAEVDRDRSPRERFDEALRRIDEHLA